MTKHWELRQCEDNEKFTLWMVSRNRDRDWQYLIGGIHVDELPDGLAPTNDCPVVRIKIEKDTDSDA